MISCCKIVQLCFRFQTAKDGYYCWFFNFFKIIDRFLTVFKIINRYQFGRKDLKRKRNEVKMFY